ncbi:DUF1707 SHOCT-like domain-containing protein [Amycolatopsis cihanbeyliensis]|uniref:Cell wall-active antibiotic response 4TMS protein YvqF n=1 Tax=Amycolatopsis cihanbeyliensis TaxID=1128664 RepID=A0A542DIR9_AMYCI|nr:DUF1707 domain-containing protein [Amycolatopsis cihanbeyliensis]TQJ03001.1 cell wall-active antibiotic response 4TMS protein YvqF [Amycolatopsis cihanbeyliensis]
MTEQPGLPDRRQLRASDADRERVATFLQQAMSEGRITTVELEERLGAVYAAKTLGELEPVTLDLPGAQPPAVQHNQGTGSQAPDRIGGEPGSKASIALMSGADRKGRWVVPHQHNSFAFWGGIDIDLREARFAEKHSTINAVAIMGGISIVVPDDIIVEVSGIGFMGYFGIQNRGEVADPHPDAPRVKITGLAFWGAVDVIRKPRKKRKQLEE